MKSRERVIAAINHQKPDQVPIDFGATGQTGISVSAMYRLREYLGLPQKALEIFEICQMLGVVDDDLRQIIKSDVIGLNHPENSLGVPNTSEKKLFRMPDGTPTLINTGNEFDVLPDGRVQMYPQGDRSAPPSIYMPAGGYFFEIIDRAPKIDEDNLTPREDFKNFFSIMTDETAKYYERESHRLYTETEYAIIGNLGGAGFGDAGAVPSPFEKYPRGIRKFDDWCMAQLLYPEYVQEVFEMQTEFMLKNLEIYKQACGDNIQIIWISGTDFGTQNAEFMSTDMFRQLYKPYYKRVCDWIHQNTSWKTFFHTCGCVVKLLDDFVDMGMDIINPVQLSAKGMDAHMLKEKYGRKLVFWGGGVDTQKILPYGTPDQVEAHVTERLDILSKDGGYVFATIHNIVGDTKPENIYATYEAVHRYNELHFGL
ncbi:MAG TPA: methyltransferase [Lachnospiraceae bacterium]|nr:methyltransferase [Lachnospiraceae bacterium]